MVEFDPRFSPLGASRERLVLCRHIGCETWTENWDALCSEHRPLKSCVVCNHVPTEDGRPCSVCENRSES